MSISITEINRNFVIRLEQLDKSTSLIGAGRYVRFVGVELANKHFNKALNSGCTKYTFSLRRGLKIHFCSK